MEVHGMSNIKVTTSSVSEGKTYCA